MIFDFIKNKRNKFTFRLNNIINYSENDFNSYLNKDFNKNYFFTINSFKKYQNIFFMNLNLRLENPVLNAKLRQKFIWDINTNISFLEQIIILLINISILVQLQNLY